ncbi:MAG: hypothetical protein SWE60_08090 [Thermodesulfobacteriota bacterium]|nr:hypothetical protein [Thermodesulfobacteriota bacterium]
MSLRYRIIESKGLVYVVGADVVTFSELMSHIQALSKDRGYEAPMKKLVDYRHIKGKDLKTKELALYAQAKAALKDVFREEKCAIVAPRDLDFGLSRVHGALVDGAGIETGVFRDLDQALSWLGVDIDDNALEGL